MPVSAVIVAGGHSKRMGFDKQLAPLCGRPVVAHSILAFEQTPDVAEIIVVTRADRVPEFEAMIRAQSFQKVRRVIPGGDERHLSVWNGLQTASPACPLVAIHDGARPLATPAVIAACIALARRTGAASVAAPVPDTVKRAGPDAVVISSVDRHGLWAMQTPQIFSRELILRAYRAILDAGELVTDEVSALQRIGLNTALLRNDDWNFKITVPRDLKLAEYVLTSRQDNSWSTKLPS